MQSVQNAGGRNEDVEEKVRQLEDQCRKNNLRIEGVNEIENKNHEQTQKKVESNLTENMGLNIKLESANKAKGHKNNRNPRTIIARFNNFRDRQKCMISAPKLKGTNIYVNEDVSKKTLEKKMSQLDTLREKRKQGFIAYFYGDRMIVKRRINSINAPRDERGNTAVPVFRSGDSLNDPSPSGKSASLAPASPARGDAAEPVRPTTAEVTKNATQEPGRLGRATADTGISKAPVTPVSHKLRKSNKGKSKNSK